MTKTWIIAAGIAALSSGAATVAQAADLLEPMPPVIAAPEPVEIAAVGGWYIRGDVGYSVLKMSEVTYATGSASGVFLGTLHGTLDNSYFIGGGVGYDTGHYLRFDLTGDYTFRSDFRGSSTGYCTYGGNSYTCTTTDLDTMSPV